MRVLLHNQRYSISSSPDGVDAGKLDLTVGRVYYPNSLSETRLGVCSNALIREASLAVWFSPAPSFRLPRDKPKAPVLLIAAGTGLAPHRAFWQENLALPAARRRPLILLFGCKDEEHLMYRDEIVAARDAGALSVFRCAFSRHKTEPKQ